MGALNVSVHSCITFKLLERKSYFRSSEKYLLYQDMRLQESNKFHKAEPFFRNRYSLIRSTNFVAGTESCGSLLCPQEPATSHDYEPDESSPYSPHLLSTRSVLILSLHLHIDSPSGHFWLGFPTSISMHFSYHPPCVYMSSPLLLHFFSLIFLVVQS
jgi:hypothetical protein